jgi:D-alanyl-D-alanine carboxypeptidase (penicillin-binding protein 5/6)
MRLKFFFTAFILSLPFWWGINIFQENLENYFYAQVSQPFQQIVEVKIPEKPQKPKLELQAKAAISVLVDPQGGEKVLFRKNTNERLPIASLTKLMTANIVLENYDLSREIKISEEAVLQEGEAGGLMAGKIFSAAYLLYPLLMESSNDAAYALANDYDGMTEEKFVGLMNLKAEDLGLENTYFVNSTGLDPLNPEEAGHSINYSTAEDLVKFAKYLLKKSSIWEILATPKFSLYGPELINTNELLWKSASWQANIFGGKTGFTDEAGGCLLLVLKNKGENFLINVILDAPSLSARIEEMEKLIEWLNGQ